ncbi:YceI family protein [Streptomyces chengbuensis]|uniref:YceI family protein n=1 Tax=Streptomyces chengbuensis TaxID=3053466 RepID=UPI0025B2D680|nr:YceI family protein [Streptomyces sp. HUAS CB01]WJY54014.1 YceI family protein [Streptomyces sp. HUAS CB01]
MLRSRKHDTVPSSRPYEGVTGVYALDPVNSMVGFSVRHAMVSNVRGKFDTFEGLLKLDGARPARSEAYLSVQTESLDTGIPGRDRHLTGADFFDSSTFPLMTFRSASVVPTGDGSFRLAGYLWIKDIELPLGVDVDFGGTRRDACGQTRIGFEGTATLQRSDWGLTWNSALTTGGVLISDKVTLVLDVSAVRLDQASAA